MKRSVLAALGCLVATAAFAQGPVYSVNVVGFNKMQFEKGKQYLVSTAFESIDGAPLRAGDVIGTQLPVNTTINYYVGGVTPYKTDSRGALTGWSTNITFNGKMGFFLKLPNTGTQIVYDVVFKGQAPMDSSISNVVAQGLNMLSYPFTADVRFRDTALYTNSAINDVMNIWQPQTTNYAPYSKGALTGWGSGTNVVFRQGMGFWYKRNPTGSILVKEGRPYPKNN